MPDEPHEPPAASPFLALLGLRYATVEGNRVSATVEAGPAHHTPWGIVRGGLYAAVIETVASLGASKAVEARDQFAVGVNNQTDFLRPHREGLLTVDAAPIQQGRNLQLWQVELRNTENKLVARGQVRLSNQSLPASSDRRARTYPE